MHPPQVMSGFAQVCFVNFILYSIFIISFCNLVYVNVHKIFEEKFGGGKKSVS